MVAITSTTTTVVTAQPKKTRRGGSAAKRIAKTKEATSSSSKDIEIDNDNDDEDDADDQVMIDVTAPSESNEDGTGPSIAITQIIDDEEADVPMDEATNLDSAVPTFGPLSASAQSTSAKSETRRVPIPPHRFGPLKDDWVNIYSPLTEILGLQVRMNVPRKSVEIRVSSSLFRTMHSYKLPFFTDIQAHQRYWRPPEGSRFRQSLCSWV